MSVRDTSREAWNYINEGDIRAKSMRDMFAAIAALAPVTRAGLAAELKEIGKPTSQVSSRVKDLLDAGYIVELEAVRDPLTKRMARPLRVATREEYEAHIFGPGPLVAVCPVCQGTGRIK